MSVQQFFSEVETVAQVLDQYVARQNHKQDYYKRLTEEEFTAVWQAVERRANDTSAVKPGDSLKARPSDASKAK